jgi:hypothetical protein
MKTSKLNIILPAIVISTIAVLSMIEVPASFLSTMAITVSGLSVTILIALTALDYRVGPKNLSAR